MKIQCNVCEVAEATVLCCADEAALCSACDEKIHAANKLASKHPRVPLANSSSHMPKCDICQDTIGYFFCLEDRALLCRKCDIAIHNANPYVSSHQRFLLTGVRVGAETAELGSSSSMGRSPSVDKVSDTDTRSVSQISAPMTVAGQYDKPVPARTSLKNLPPTKRSTPMPMVEDYAKELPAEGGNVGDYSQTRVSFAGGPGSAAQWHIDDFLGFNEYNQNFSYTDQGSSKADSGKFGESDSSSILRTTSEDELEIDERLGQVPDMGRSVFKIPSPPTASGLFWPRTSQELASTAYFVPDIYLPDEHNSHYNYPRNGHTNTRRRHY
ncbi:hypothetical protein V2J09_007320 [Rumex salicifolius]